jgi:hypothetical protein
VTQGNLLPKYSLKLRRVEPLIFKNNMADLIGTAIPETRNVCACFNCLVRLRLETLLIPFELLKPHDACYTNSWLNSKEHEENMKNHRYVGMISPVLQSEMKNWNFPTTLKIFIFKLRAAWLWDLLYKGGEIEQVAIGWIWRLDGRYNKWLENFGRETFRKAAACSTMEIWHQ